MQPASTPGVPRHNGMATLISPRWYATPKQPSARPSSLPNRPLSMPCRLWAAQVSCRTIPPRCGCVTRQQWSKASMIDFILSKTQQAARDYAHQVALEEMRPISLECDRAEYIPESFFWNMQRRFWGGAAAPARTQGQEENEKQENVRSMRSQWGMGGGDAAA